MSRIVVLESENRQTEPLRDGLAEDGWLVETFTSYEKAAAAIAEKTPQLVIASADVSGAEKLLRENSLGAGGTGALALVEPGSGGSAAATAADSVLHRPFAGQDLRLAVRNLMTQAKSPAVVVPSADGERLTSQDLFGDLLAEVEGETAKPAPPVAAPAPPPSAFDRQLSGMLKDEGRRSPAATAKKDEPGVDDLLSKTLSGLEIGDRTKKAATATPKPAPRSTRPPETKPEKPKKSAPPPASAKPSGAPQPVDRLLDAVKPAPEAPRRMASKPIDLSDLDAFARRPSSDRTPTAPETFATQKVAIPTTPRGAGGPLEFGQYTLLERIALGGMAEVWKARMKGVEGFQKTVAIKKILPHLTDSTDFVTMFVDEAKLAAQLNHTNIIHIYDLGKIADDYYIAMEYVDGKDLRSILNTAREKDSPLPLSLSLLVASRLAAALDHAHRQKDFEGRPLGLVHRDVSPQNVLISFDGDIKLCDFGIVKAVSKASKTQMGALKGKLQYMSPEQAWGRPVDARSDIFSLGSLLFEMLTGRRLFAGESEMSVLDAVREGRIQAPRDLDPRVPLEVNATVLKALAREPKDRFQSAGDLQREIDGILASLKPAPSQRDLAGYMQRLFDVGARPERSAEAAAASTPPAHKGAPTAGAPTPSVPSVAGGAPTPALTPAPGSTDAALEAAPGGKKNLLWIGLAAAAVIAALAFSLTRGGKSENPTPATPAAPTPSVAPANPAATTELGAATASAPTTSQPAADEPKEAATESKPGGENGAAAKEETARPEPAKVEAAKPETPKAEAVKPATAEPSKKAANAPTAVAPPPVATAPASEAPSKTEEPAPAPAAANTPATPAPQPVTPSRAAAVPVAPAVVKQPSIREGDLVAQGPGVDPPVLVSVNNPEYPPIARRMRVEGTVVLSLLVDENGRVLDVRLENGVSQNVGLNEAAMAAARTAKFRPAMKDGVRVKTWHRLTIPFKL